MLFTGVEVNLIKNNEGIIIFLLFTIIYPIFPMIAI